MALALTTAGYTLLIGIAVVEGGAKNLSGRACLLKFMVPLPSGSGKSTSPVP
jgi:hypothetical protein